MNRMIEITKFYGSLPAMLKKYDKYARQDAFRGSSCEEFEDWKKKGRKTIRELLGMQYMETCPLEPKVEEVVTLDDGIVREKVIIQVEPDTWMPVYILIPPKEDERKQECVLALPGHQGGGKYSVAGRYDIPVIKKQIEFFNYDYGMQLAKRGYVALCPDCRGFGERRDEALQNADSEEAFVSGTCFHLAHMAGPLGMTVAGMCVWDAMRLIDYVYERGQWDTGNLGAVGFSGGGMQLLWLAALDERVKRCIISGYMYGYKDSLMILNGNCNCNYVPNLWKHYDCGDIASMIAPRKLIIQSCREDHLNGPRGLENVYEQMETVNAAYALYLQAQSLIHDIREGGHRWHEEVLDLMFSRRC